MLGKTAKLLGPAAHRKGLELLLDIRPAAPQFVRGDPAQLGQIIAHLTGNAIKFTERGEIVLQVDTESQDAAGVVSHFMVLDTGIGIPPETQQVIFEPFSNVYSSM